MASQHKIVDAMQAAVTKRTRVMDPHFINKHRNHHEIQELEVMKLD